MEDEGGKEQDHATSKWRDFNPLWFITRGRGPSPAAGADAARAVAATQAGEDGSAHDATEEVCIDVADQRLCDEHGMRPEVRTSDRTPVLLCSPCRVQHDRELAPADAASMRAVYMLYTQRCVRHCIARNEAPMVPHFTFTLVYNPEHEHERAKGLESTLAMLPFMKRVVLYVDLGLTPGMRELELQAHLRAIPVYRRTINQGSAQFHAQLGRERALSETLTRVLPAYMALDKCVAPHPIPRDAATQTPPCARGAGRRVHAKPGAGGGAVVKAAAAAAAAARTARTARTDRDVQLLRGLVQRGIVLPTLTAVPLWSRATQQLFERFVAAAQASGGADDGSRAHSSPTDNCRRAPGAPLVGEDAGPAETNLD
jgi:hypothetical protein